MIRLLLFTFIVVPVLALSQDDRKIMKLKKYEFNSFPNDHSVVQKAFEYYYDIGFMNKKIDSLNDHQKILCLHYICDGVIDNSGFYSILAETNGEFNVEYSKALQRIEDSTGKVIFDEIVTIYNTFEKWFSKGEIPPTLSDASKEFDKKLYHRIEYLQKKWYEGSAIRDQLFHNYLSKHKQDLVTSE